MKKITLVCSMFFLMFSALPVQDAAAQTLESDSLALLAFHEACCSESGSYTNWSYADISEWDKVTVSWIINDAGTDSVQRVTNVNFYSTGLTGTLPDDLGNLTEMTGDDGVIQFRDQPGLTGTFPACIWNWTKVQRMQIKECGFTDMDVTGLENMVNLTEFNTQSTPFAGEIPVELFNLPLIQKLYLHESMWSSLPANMPATTPTPLSRFYINGNQFTDLPDLSSMVWASGAKIYIKDNYLTFEDIEPNMGIASDTTTFTYSPQAMVNADDVSVYAAAGEEVVLQSNISGATSYTWVKNETEPIAYSQDFTIASFDPATDAGSYYCLAQNSNVSGLDITTGNKILREVANYANTTAVDSLALLAFFEACCDSSGSYSNWTYADLAEWDKVTTSWILNDEGTDSVLRVTNLMLNATGLIGTLPDELGNLTEMTGDDGVIQLRDQPGLTGTLSACMWNWTKVERMQIKDCAFTDMDITGLENMVNLTEFNTQGTPFAGEVPVVLFNLPLMQKLYLHESMWTSLPADIPTTTPTPLSRLYLNGNQFTDLPDLSGMVWANGAKIYIKDNYLTFEDIESNMVIASDTTTFTYSPQGLLAPKDTFTLAEGDALELSAICGGTANTYMWVKDGALVDGVDSETLTISSTVEDNSGVYYCLVQNSIVTGLDLVTDTFIVTVKNPSALSSVEASTLQINGNPTSDILSIDSKDMIGIVTITDLSGKIVKSELVDSQNLRMSISDLRTGIYLVRLQGDTLDSVVKIVKN